MSETPTPETATAPVDQSSSGSVLADLLLILRARRIARVSVELSVAFIMSLAATIALTWPLALHLDEVLIGGGELGGWLWRQWWHFTEVDALAREELGLIGSAEQLLSLGRYPETGNILDILLLSYPLDQLVGFPAGHNLKVLAILVGNGLCGYVLARSLTRSPVVAVVAALVAVINPLAVQDINKTGLRQVVLWWLLLYPVFLTRAERTERPRDAAAAGAVFVLCAAFYWFYGLFAAMFTAIRIVAWWWRTRASPLRLVKWVGALGMAAAVGSLIFLSPYLSSGDETQGQAGINKLPEVTFMVPYPAYDTIASAPLRPSNYRENVLSSLHRGIDSAWPADTVFNPGHGGSAYPIAIFFVGLLPACFIKGARSWVVVWLVFWLGSMGPFLKLGAGNDTADVVMLGDYVVRLPYALMFQFVPGMSRMFAPYRLAAFVVVASVAVLAISLQQAQGWKRPVFAVLTGLSILVQPFYRFDLGPVGPSGRPTMWRVPTQMSGFQLPEWYAGLDPQDWGGIIELPLEQQQDLLAAYQAFHRRKVYRSWATLPAIPPLLRSTGGGEHGRRLRWLAAPEPNRDAASELLRELSREPLETDLSQLRPEDLARVVEAGKYRYIVVHERGFFLVRPHAGSAIYRDVVHRLAVVLGMQPTEHTEQQAFDWPGKTRSFPSGPAWVPWASQEVQLPSQEMPDRYLMSVFDLSEWEPRAGDGTALEGEAVEEPAAEEGHETGDDAPVAP